MEWYRKDLSDLYLHSATQRTDLMVNNYDSFFLVVQYTFINDELAQKNSQGHQSTSISTCTFGINDIHFTRSTSAMMRGRVIITNYFSSGAVASAGEKAQKLYGFYTHTSPPLLRVRVGTCPPPPCQGVCFLPLLVKGNLFSSSKTRWILALLLVVKVGTCPFTLWHPSAVGFA